MKKGIIVGITLFCTLFSINAQEKTQYDWYLSILPQIKSKVAPMLTTKWGQNAPYNNFCPLAPGKNIHCKTGCVATSMAQVMKYYRYPQQGKGYISYEYQGDDKKKHRIEKDLNNSVYEWEKMKDAYTPFDNSSMEEKDAVAKIMADCGAAVRMQYGQYDSGAFEMDVEKALKEHFSYDSLVTYMTTFDNISDSIWFCTLYQQLSDGMPVIYGGSTSNYLAHSFVVDGYNEEGKFHVVYGLGGGDGYVNLKEIAYRYGHSMIINIRPPKHHTAIQSYPDSMQKSVEKTRYRLDGTRISIPQRGINIVQMSNGTIKKVIVP